ncbi:unnamed protein product [Polarella glacialis]|uniref:Uncharacterized protein n=1 Tax=Polarella glacialis TaxID=89957 RepID=A0A813LWU0_POLGL|nr:unnamed protein product [Polarella glacialis]CAE8734922.1 unnamed protein product [Polarella glacialis]
MKLPSFLSTWQTPQVLAIEDARLGVMGIVLKIVTLAYVIVNLFVARTYNFHSTPGGFPTWWFEPGELADAHSAGANYCTDPKYHWDYTPTETYWNERDIKCKIADYTDMVQVAAADLMAFTYVKEEHRKNGPCSSSVADACSVLPVSGLRSVTNEVLPQGTNATCKCGKQQDYFLLGVDSLVLALQHSFTTGASTEYVSGSSNLAEKQSKTARAIKTCLRKPKGSAAAKCKASPLKEEDWGDCCIREFTPGETMMLTIGEWVAAGGISLDDRLTGQVKPSPTDGTFPFRRTAGVKLHFMMRYYGDAGGAVSDGDETFKCEISISAKDGWTSAGAKNTYVSFNGNDDSEYYNERTRRGIRFEFFAEGAVEQFDYQSLINTLVAGMVFLGVSDILVGLVAFYALPEKDVYANAKTRQMNYARELARFGLDAAIACEAFKNWNLSGQGAGKDESISKDELASVYISGGFDAETGNQFAQVVVEECSKDGESSISCSELVDLMSTDLVSIERLQKHADKNNVKRSKNAVVPLEA